MTKRRSAKFIMAAGVATAAIIVPQAVLADTGHGTGGEISIPSESQDQINPQADGVGSDLITDTDEDRRAALEKEFGIELDDSDRWVDRGGELTPDGDAYTSHDELKEQGTYGINASRQELLQYGIRTGDWKPYDSFSAISSPAHYDLVDGEYEKNKHYYGSLIKSRISNFNGNESIRDDADEIAEHNRVVGELVEEYKAAPGVVPYVIGLNSNTAYADEWGVDEPAADYFDSKWNGVLESGEFKVTDQEDEVDKDEVDKDEVDKDEVDKDEVDKDEVDKDEVDKDEVDKDEVDKDEVYKGNKTPEITGGINIVEIEDITGTIASDEERITLDYKAYFTDVDNAELKFTTIIDGENMNFYLHEDGNSLDILPNVAGVSTVEVRAENGNGTEVSQTFSVTILHEDGYGLVDDDTTVVDDDTTVVDEDNVIVKDGHVDKDGKKLYKLPQTGSQAGSLTGPIGMLLVGLATALGFVRRKK